MRRKIRRDLPAFAPKPASAGRLSIVSVHSWRLPEPDSGRRYTVLRLETRGGMACGLWAAKPHHPAFSISSVQSSKG
jgi:hypothetical protein